MNRNISAIASERLFSVDLHQTRKLVDPPIIEHCCLSPWSSQVEQVHWYSPKDPNSYCHKNTSIISLEDQETQIRLLQNFANVKDVYFVPFTPHDTLESFGDDLYKMLRRANIRPKTIQTTRIKIKLTYSSPGSLRTLIVEPIGSDSVARALSDQDQLKEIAWSDLCNGWYEILTHSYASQKWKQNSCKTSP